MRVLIVGKYPPIEGGVSSHTYWLARGLGEAGHKVAVVTNAPRVEEEYRAHIVASCEHEGHSELIPKNVALFSLKKPPPMHIPYSESYVTRLTNLGLRAVEEHGADVIYTHYLEPYAVAGYMLKQFTGLPLVVRHAGSDIYRLLNSEDFSYVLGRILKRADLFLVSRMLFGMARSLGIPPRRIRSILGRALPPQFSPEGPRFDTAALGVKPNEFLITYLGKASERKGIDELLEAVAPLDGVKVLLVSKGRRADAFREKIAADGRLRDKVIMHDFVAPWIVPSILRASNMLAHLENRFPIPIHGPSQPFEAITCGTPLLLSGEMYKKIQPGFPETSGLFSVVEDPHDVSALREVIRCAHDDEKTLRENARRIRDEFAPKNDWDKYINSHVELFERTRGVKRRISSFFLPYPR